MRQKLIWPVLSLALAAACVVLLVLWQGEKGGAPELDDLRLHGMTEAHARFSDYLRLGHKGDYWYGAAEFQTMVNCARAENLDGMIDANAAAGVLMYSPELAQDRLEDVCAILETCMAQPDNTAQWAVSMNELRHLLEEGEL